MNSGVIVKVEYKPNSGGDYQELDVIPYSGNLQEPIKETPAGNLYSLVSNFKIAKVNPETDSLLNGITGRRATFRITDANGIVYTVGDTSYRAQFTFARRVDGTPGSFNGYDCTISREAPTQSPAE